MKKVITLLLVISLFLLIGCSQSTESVEPSEDIDTDLDDLSDLDELDAELDDISFDELEDLDLE